MKTVISFQRRTLQRQIQIEIYIDINTNYTPLSSLKGRIAVPRQPRRGCVRPAGSGRTLPSASGQGIFHYGPRPGITCRHAGSASFVTHEAHAGAPAGPFVPRVSDTDVYVRVSFLEMRPSRREAAPLHGRQHGFD